MMSEHGTLATYCNHGCRCDDCRTAQRDYMRRYRSTQIGRQKARYSSKVKSRVAQRCMEYMRTHHRDIYYSILDTEIERASDG